MSVMSTKYRGSTDYRYCRLKHFNIMFSSVESYNREKSCIYVVVNAYGSISVLHGHIINTYVHCLFMMMAKAIAGSPLFFTLKKCVCLCCM